MIRLAPGTPKYLLLDDREIARNKERQKAGAPIVCVAEILDDGKTVLHRGYRVSASAILAYSRNVPLLRVRLAPDLPDTDIYAAYYTEGAVLLAESFDEPIDIAAAAGLEPPEEPKAKKQK